MTLYFVTEWSERYENNRSRLIKDLNWVPIPNNHDGEAYARVMAHKNAAKIFSAWILILQVASRCKPRGELIRANGTAYDSESLSLRTRAPLVWFDEAMPVLLEIGWLSHKELTEKHTALGRHPDVTPTSPQVFSTVTERREEKEGRKEGKAQASPVVLPFSSEEFGKAWQMFEQHRREIKKAMTPTAAKLSLEMLARIGEPRAVRCIRHTIEKGWQGLREPDGAGAVAYQPERKAVTEPSNWKAVLNHEYPDSVYSSGGMHEAHTWEGLPREVQGMVWAAIKRAA